MSKTSYWRKNADSHAKDLVRTLRLYFRGHMPMEAIENVLRKIIGDSALLTQQSIALNMEEVKELIQKLKITTPEKFSNFFPNTKEVEILGGKDE